MTEKSTSDISSETIARKQYFLKLAVQTLVQNGAVATILADYVRRLLVALKLDAEFTYVPGCLTVFMKEEVSPAHGAQTLAIKTGLGYNFDKLEDTEEVLADLMGGNLFGGLDEATSRLEKIRRRPNLYGAWIHPLGWSIIAGLATIMLGGKLVDAVVSLGTGLIFGLCLVACDYYPPLGFTFEFWVSYLISAILAGVQVLYPNFTYWPAFLASVILILPGFSMSMGFLDVFSRQTVVGLTTLFNAAWMALMIGLGAFMGFCSVATVLGRPLMPLFPREYAGGPPSIKLWMHFPVYAIFNFFLNLTFQAKLREAFLIIPLATAAFGVFNALALLGVQDEANILLSCLFMATAAHIYGKFVRRSEIPSIFSGIIVYAPGTYGARATYYSLLALFGSADGKALDVKSALYAFKQGASMLTISASIAIGLLLARALFGRF